MGSFESSPSEVVKYRSLIFYLQVVVLFNLCALTEMGNHKNSFMGMWALRPSLFSLFSEGLRPTDRIIAHHFPTVSFATVKALEAHSRKHNHFLTSSSMMLRERESSPLLANINPSTATNLNRSVLVLVDVFGHFRRHGKATLILCLEWAQDIVGAIVKGRLVLVLGSDVGTRSLHCAILTVQ